MKCLLLPLTAKAGWYEPAGRSGHSTAVVGESLFLWAGYQEEVPGVHNNLEKRAFLSRVEVFYLQRRSWEQQTTSGIACWTQLALLGWLHNINCKLDNRAI